MEDHTPQSGTPTNEHVETDTFMPPGPPLLTKAIASAFCGVVSIPTCFCFGLPSIVLGAIAIVLGVWVRKHYRGNTASEAANVASWVGTIAGGIGIVLGVIAVIMWLLGGAGIGLGILDEASRNSSRGY